MELRSDVTLAIKTLRRGDRIALRRTEGGLMKLTTERIDRALSQMESMVIPSATPVEQQLCSIFGDHTFFLSNRGVSTLEPIDAEQRQADRLARARQIGHDRVAGRGGLRAAGTGTITVTGRCL